MDRRVHERELLDRLKSFGGSCQGQYSAKLRFPRGSDMSNHPVPILDGCGLSDKAIEQRQAEREASKGRQMMTRPTGGTFNKVGYESEPYDRPAHKTSHALGFGSDRPFGRNDNSTTRDTAQFRAAIAHEARLEALWCHKAGPDITHGDNDITAGSGVGPPRPASLGGSRPFYSSEFDRSHAVDEFSARDQRAHHRRGERELGQDTLSSGEYGSGCRDATWAAAQETDDNGVSTGGGVGRRQQPDRSAGGGAHITSLLPAWAV